MAKITFATEVMNRVRRHSWLFLPLRGTYRFLKSIRGRFFRILFAWHPTWGPALGFYSGAKLLREGKASGAILAERQTVPSFAPESLVKLCGLNQDGYQPWPIFWMRIPDARLCGGNLVPRDRGGHLLAEATFSQEGDRNDPAFDHLDFGDGCLIPGNATSIVSRWGGYALGPGRPATTGYWHWLFDSVARLSLLDQFPSDTKVITPPLTPWMRWFLEKLGVASRVVETDVRSLRVENFYFSSPSSMSGCWNPHAVDFLRRSFLPFGSAPSDAFPRKFYIVREGYTRGLANEAEVRDFYASRRWALIAPEKYSIPEQIALFRDAEAVAGLHGSALTNLLWCSPGASVQEFVPDNFMAGAFEWLATYNNLHHRFLICKTDQNGKAIVPMGEIPSCGKS